MVVENKIIVELKSVQAFIYVYIAQVLTYLKVTNLHFELQPNLNT
ncbi:GxxExxY protein [Tenuifilum sp.]